VSHPWVAYKRLWLRRAAWHNWCLERRLCRQTHGLLLGVLDGQWGRFIAARPEGRYISTFLGDARAYGVPVRWLLAIGVVESSAWTTTPWYQGCLDGRTAGSGPGQIACSASVVSRVGLAGYNAGDPSYPSRVISVASGIAIR
jgi:hypothetical protein